MSFRSFGASTLALLLAAAPAGLVPAAPAQAQIGIGIGVSFNVALAPPALPVYVQPPLPAPGYIWTPGYWAYGDAGYYWVPGTWVLPPSVGLLWTPGYWGWHAGFYGFNPGYWGPHVGFYGGINYGFGYTGTGFFGGEWRGGAFAYNSAYNNFGGVHVTNVFNRTVVVNHVTNVSFNGPGGITAQPTPQERAFSAERHLPPTAMQAQHIQMAATNPALRASVNHGMPAIAATARPGEFHGAGVVAAHPALAAAHPVFAAEHPGLMNAHPAMVAQHPVYTGEHPVFVGEHPAAAANPYAVRHPYAAAHPWDVAHRTAAPAARPMAPRPAPHPAAPHPAGKPHR